jgi:hypothetical protein
VRRASQVFYRQHEQVLRGLPGCAVCPEPCHYGPMAKRIVDQPDTQVAFWAFASLCVRAQTAALASWDPFVAGLLRQASARMVRPADRSHLGWCVVQLAAEHGLMELRQRGVSIGDISSLLDLFTAMCIAFRDKAPDAPLRVSQFRARAGAIFRLEAGPHDGCELCDARCVFQFLGRRLADQKPLRERLSRAFKAKDSTKAVREFCLKTASECLMNVKSPAVQSLGKCLYVHMAKAVDAANVAQAMGRIFPADQPGNSDKRRSST